MVLDSTILDYFLIEVTSLCPRTVSGILVRSLFLQSKMLTLS